MEDTEKMDFSPDITEACGFAYGAGSKIVQGVFKNRGGASEKGDLAVGHHAIVTGNDIGAQEYILRGLSQKFPTARFITEERADSFGGKIVSKNELESLDQIPLIFIVDPLDGTSQCNRDLYEWSVSIGVMRKGVLVGGAIHAPMIRKGIGVIAERGRGINVEDPFGDSSRPRPFAETRRKSMVYIGPDIFFLPQYQRSMLAIAKEVQTVSCTGSCALGLALVAMGGVDLLIQPVQCPWDWAAGSPLVESAGGKVLFYSYASGKNDRENTQPQVLEKPDPLSYSSEKRNTAFIAGKPELVDWFWEQLQNEWEPISD